MRKLLLQNAKIILRITCDGYVMQNFVVCNFRNWNLLSEMVVAAKPHALMAEDGTGRLAFWVWFMHFIHFSSPGCQDLGFL